jgi:hypothetical protein
MGVGQFVGPVFAGILSDRFGPSVIGNFAGCAYFAGMIFALYDGAVVQKFYFVDPGRSRLCREPSAAGRQRNRIHKL